ARVGAGDEDPEAQISAAAPEYLLGERVGFGSFGEVFRVTRDSGLGPLEFAMKVHNPSPFVSAEKALKRFEREFRAVRDLQHRGIIQYFDAGLTREAHPFIVMPFIEGQNLRDATSADDPVRSVRYLIEVVGAVGYAHSKGVLHRDLKPANILVRQSDHQPVILDFGLAYMFDDATSESLTTAALGTGAYVPHEVLIDPKKRTVLHDIYSCGVILYEVLARQWPDPRSYVPLADRDQRFAPIDHVVQKALAPAKERYQSADALLGHLRRLPRKLKQP
ncbi:MAG: serine/threonine-protein kinase, partial [Myxococcaceae bacterium]